MILPTDRTYKQTKKIIQGNSKMAPLYRPLADWIDSTYDVRTINIIHDYIDGNKRPRLNICFEFEKERTKFNGSNHFGFDEKKQTAIAKEFERLMRNQSSNNSNGFFKLFKRTDNQSVWKDLWVIYSAFEPIAKIEANEQIPESRIKRLKSEINNPEIWEISRAFSGVTFFLHTDEQLKKYENSPIQENWKQQYLEILKEYDQFGYFNNKNFSIYLDSKENFDNNYESNWYYYYK